MQFFPSMTILCTALHTSGYTFGWVENTVPQSPAIITFRSSQDTVITNDIKGLEVSRLQSSI